MGTVTLEFPEQQFLQWASQLSPVAKRQLLEQLLIDIGLDDYAALTDEQLIANAESVFWSWRKPKHNMANPQRGEVWIADLGYAAKIRPLPHYQCAGAG